MLNYFNKRRKKGQSTLEYAILIIIIIGALLSIQVYIKRGIQGRWKAAVDDLGEQFKKETIYYWEHIKYLKKPGTGITKGFFDKEEAIKVIKECQKRYTDIYLKNFD